jgi:DNA-binding XRE family transcriptional regulator
LPRSETARVIRVWRYRVAMTQKGLAEALSINWSTVSRWEDGHDSPSKLAWTALQCLAAEHRCPLVQRRDRDAKRRDRLAYTLIDNRDVETADQTLTTVPATTAGRERHELFARRVAVGRR